MSSMIATRVRHRLAWLLVPVLIMASSGGQFCWCHDNGDDHHHGTDSEQLDAIQHHHDEAKARAEHARRQPETPIHDHDSPDSGCRCVGTDTPATEVSKGAVSEAHVAASAIGSWVSFPPPGLTPSRVVGPPGWSVRAHAPPLFVLNCTYRC